MSFFEKRPMVMIVLGVIGISLSSIFVKFSAAPSAVTAVIFAQIPTAMQLIGGGLILGGVFWYSRIEGREEQA